MSDTTPADALKAMSAAYVALLALSPGRRVFIQKELCMLRDAIVSITGEDAEDVQDEHETSAFNSPLRAHWVGRS